FRKSLLRIVARNIEVTQHPVTRRDIGHLSLGVRENLFSLIELPLSEIKGRKGGSRSWIFGLRLNCRFELFAGVFAAVLGKIQGAKIHGGSNGSGVERLSLLEISFGFAEGAPLLLQEREVDVRLCLAGL